MKKLSVVVLAKNEQDSIADCLKRLAFADEIIVIDDMSEDQTAEIAKKLGAQVYVRKLDDFASQRNFGLSKAGGKWVLFIDADELVPVDLEREIVRHL
ncbi:MAG TPA: glycosyltransferase family 2 protein [Patescibacteria group bacterium]|nr:glycosyltransferase family 2 protein [Patescibacteria group bacterium]